MDPANFKLTSIVVPITLEGTDGLVEYEMREMTAASRDQYLDQLTSRMRLDSAGRPAGMKKFEGLQSSLVVRCLRRKDGKPLPESEVQTWPASVVSELFNMAQTMNHLNKLEEEPAPKND